MFFLPGFSELQQVIKSLSQKEKRLLTKMSSLRSSSSAPSKSPLSQIDISICWTFSRLARNLLDAKDGIRASRVINSAMNLLGKFQVGIGQLDYLQATLTYQECLSMLLIKSSQDEIGSVSELCEPAWSRSRVVDSAGTECLTSEFSRFGFNENLKTPGLDFKTPKYKVLRTRMNNEKHGSRTKVNGKTNKNVGCRAPIKKSVKSFFEHNFEDADVEIDKINPVSNGKGRLRNEGSEGLTPQQPEMATRRVIPVVTISDKENSDMDDTMSPVGATKRKIKFSAGRSLRSKAKITFVDVAADGMSDDAVGSAQTKKSKTASKHGSNL